MTTTPARTAAGPRPAATSHDTDDAPPATDTDSQTRATVVRRPGPKRANGTGRAGKRSFDVDDELWFAAVAAAHARGISLASVLRGALEDLVASESSHP